jgi:outer membrane protein insertion porin family
VWLLVALAALPSRGLAMPGAQVQAAAAGVSTRPTICGLPVPIAKSPPPGSRPVVLAFGLCFSQQGGSSLIEPETYLFYIRLKPSQPSLDVWIPYDDEDTRRVMLDDFKRLWETRFLDDLSVEVSDYVFENGVVGKLVTYHLEERQRIKVVDYDGATKVDRSAIEDRLKEKNLQIRLDSFIDPGVLRGVAATVRNLYAEKGYQFAEVTPEIRETGAAKTVNVTFHVTEGPRVAIRDVEFTGNKAFSDDQLGSVTRANKAYGLLSMMHGAGTYQSARFEEDADRLVTFYREHGYITAQVGQPDLRPLDDARDGKTRWVQLRIPITEGRQYVVGDVRFEGATTVKPEVLRPLFKLRTGDTYNEADVRKGMDKAKEAYGRGGYYEFTGYPDLAPREDEPEGPSKGSGRGIVDVTIRLQEGKQYFVHRITFVGNTHTRDEVIRRELMLVEAGVFNTEGLKQSVRRLNQLGYFKPLEGEAIGVDKTPGEDDKVNVRLKLEEQNRNQISFGGGVSQYDGLFVNGSYTTSNFLGRGETASVSVQSGSRAKNYQLAFTEPYLFERPMMAGVTLYSRKVDYRLTSDAVDYSEVRSGGSATAGVAVRHFTRLYVTYGYEVVDSLSSPAFRTALTGNSASTFGAMADGRYIQSSATPTVVLNTVDNPFAPRSGKRLTASYQYAGGILGGTTDFVKPEVEAVMYIPMSARTAIGVRANTGAVWNYGATALPYYLRYFLGGETQIRGTEIRSVGPSNENNAALGGTKFVLFNAEYYYDFGFRVRALLFHDAGQTFDESSRLDLRQLRTSSGVELRVTLPVIGAPFRLIYAWNIYRDTTQPARTFKFAVGTTF